MRSANRRRSAVRPLMRVYPQVVHQSRRVVSRKSPLAAQRPCSEWCTTLAWRPRWMRNGPARVRRVSTITSARPMSSGARKGPRSRRRRKPPRGSAASVATSTCGSSSAGGRRSRASRSSGVAVSGSPPALPMPPSIPPPPPRPGPSAGRVAVALAATTGFGAAPSGQRAGVTPSRRRSSIGAGGSSSRPSPGPLSSARKRLQRAMSSSWVPSSTTSPRSRTTIRSARRSVDRR